MVIVEELEHALARGAKIYGELSGYGSTADAYRITDTHPEGRGAISCIANERDALTRSTPEGLTVALWIAASASCSSPSCAWAAT